MDLMTGVKKSGNSMMNVMLPGGSVMVWGCKSFEGHTDLHVPDLTAVRVKGLG